MASRSIELRVRELDLEGVDNCLTWLMSFEAKCAIEKVADTAQENTQGLKFISKAGIPALKKLREINSPNDLFKMTYADIKASITAYIQPKQKLVVAERAKFYTQKQTPDESVTQFVAKLKKAAMYCEFEALRKATSIEQEILLLQLIVGLNSPTLREAVLLENQKGKLDLNATIEYIQNSQQITDFCTKESPTNTSEVNYAKFQSRNNASSKAQFTSNKKCSFCGMSWHKTLNDCPARRMTCNKCQRQGHFAKVCRQPSKSGGSVNAVLPRSVDVDDHQDACESIFMLSDDTIGFIDTSVIDVKINGTNVKMLVDTGASCTLISTVQSNAIEGKIVHEQDSALEAYDGHKISSTKSFTASVEYNGQLLHNKTIRVVDCNRKYGLLGRDILSAIHIDHVMNNSLPTIRGVKASIIVNEDCNDKFCAARKVPLAMQEKVNSELDRLEALGILERCPSGGVRNASPVVWVTKKNGSLRMCPDYSVHVNNKIRTESYPLPHIETLLSKLDGARYFAKVDLKDAYWQVELDDSAKELCAINTSKGLYFVKRLQMGMKNSASVFQNCMENSVLKGLTHVIAYQDDLIIYASTEASLEKHLAAVLGRLREKRVTVNPDKCVGKARSIEFLGRVVSEEGIAPSPAHCKSIAELKPPTNIKQLQYILGLFTYFSHFIDNFSDKTLHMREANNKKLFEWSEKCAQEFECLKKLLTSPPLLQPYSLTEPVLLETDASGTAVAAVLTQNRKPVLFLSKSLSSAERNWSNIEREAYAIVWAVTKLKQYLCGRHFVIHSDHKPLQFIFAPNTKLPLNVSARIGRWAIQLMAYDYSIQHISGKDLPHVDALSRLPCSEGGTVFNTDDVPFSYPTVCDELKGFSEQNQHYANLKQSIVSGRWKHDSVGKKFWRWKNLLTVEGAVIYKGTKVYIPPELRKQVLEAAHDTHQGINLLFNKISREFWWPGMWRDVMRFVYDCGPCQSLRAPVANKTLSWPTSDRWERIHIDWADEPNFGCVLIVIDSGTNYLDAYMCKNRSSSEVKKCLSRSFALFGIPKCIVSDNAPEFVCQREWLAHAGCRLVHSPTYNPRSNGVAERAVQTVKVALRAWSAAIGDKFMFLQKVLLNHRSSSGGSDQSPAERLMKMKLRTQCNAQFCLLDAAMYRNSKMKVNKPVTVVTQVGRNTALVVDDDEHSWLASHDQLTAIPRRIESQTTTPPQTDLNWRSTRARKAPERLHL